MYTLIHAHRHTHTNKIEIGFPICGFGTVRKMNMNGEKENNLRTDLTILSLIQQPASITPVVLLTTDNLHTHFPSFF